MDFVHDQLATGRKIRVLTIVDTFSRFSPAVDPRFSYRGEDVVLTLERICKTVGYPKTVAGVATSLAEAPARPQFVRVQAAARPSASSGAGYRPTWAAFPTSGARPMRVSASPTCVTARPRPGGPSGGRQLVEFDGKPVRNLYDLTYELQQHRPEDAVTLKVVRDGNPVEVKAVLRQTKLALLSQQ